MFGETTEALLKFVDEVKKANDPVAPIGWTIEPSASGSYAYAFEKNGYECTTTYPDRRLLWGYGSSIADCIAQINEIINSTED